MMIQAINYNTTFNSKIKYNLVPKNELVDLIKAGYTQKQIAEKYCIPRHVITRSIKTYSLLPKKMKYADRRVNTINQVLKNNKD